MNIKLTRSEKGSNTGSVRTLTYYLEKENDEKASHEKGWFFDQNKDGIAPEEVIEAIDNNNLGLKRRDGKFYLVNISPSERELAFIGNDSEKLKAFTRRAMDAYARNFKRDITGDDLLYFAKIEQKRYYKGFDKAVKDGNAKQGTEKPGLQTHIHVIVSRKDRYGKRQFSPLSNHRFTKQGPVRGGFIRKDFYTAVETAFDEETGYKRRLNETFVYRNTMLNGTAKEKQVMEERLTQERQRLEGKRSASLSAVAKVLKSVDGISEERDQSDYSL